MTANRSKLNLRFNLRSLLIFTAVWAMFLTLVFSRKNPWPIVLMSIVYLLLIGRTFRNCYHANFRVGLLIVVASLLFVLSLYMPAIQLPGAPKAAYGWTAAWVVASPNVPKSRLAVVAYGAMRLGNLLAVMSPWFVRRMMRQRDRWYPVLMIPCASIAWSVPLVEGLQLKIGYFLWASSLTLIAFAAVVPIYSWFHSWLRTRRSQKVS